MARVKRDVAELLACPACSGDLTLIVSHESDGEVLEGRFECDSCGSGYPIIRGVPRFNMKMDELENVARTFGYEWKAHHEGKFEDEGLFGRSRDEDWQLVLDSFQIENEAVRGKVVLDAGCGSGRFCQLFTEHGAAVVVGVDIIDAIDEAYEACRAYENIHMIQANIFALPFKKQRFDLIWSQGVIHHTPDAAGAHRSLSQFVRPGGMLYVWVYARRFNPFRFTKTILDLTRVSRLPPRALLTLSRAMSYVSLGLLFAYRAVRSIPGLRPRTAWGERTVRPRTLREVQLTWFDAISPEFDSRHTEQEVIGWFRREGFQDIRTLEEPKVGVRGVAK